MPTPPVPRAQLVRAVQAIEAAIADGCAYPARSRHDRSAIHQAARKLGIPETTLRGRLLEARRLGLDVGETDNYEPRPIRSEEPADPERQSAAEIEAAGLRARVADAEKRARDLMQRVHDLQEFRASVFGLAPAAVECPPFRPRVSAGGGYQATPIICLSDEQVGEVVRADEMAGYNGYNVDTYRARVRRYITKAAQIIERREPACSGVIVWLGGDAISGGIHQELAETDEVPPLEQARVHISETVPAIRALADRFGHVSVYCTPGNHGRTTIKPRSKRYGVLNYESVIYDAIEAQFLTDDRVTVSVPPSGDAYFQIGNINVLATHGDRIGRRGGQGAIGPAATIMGGAHKTRAQYAREGRPVDVLLLGHFHYPVAVAEGVVVNGTPVGYSEYARQHRMVPLRPTQTIAWVHPVRGLEGVEWVYLE